MTSLCTPDYGYGVREILFLIKLKHENKLQVGRDDADAGKNDPPSRWRRDAFLASRLRDGNRPFQHSGVSGEEGAIRKELETQHWLELIDGYLPLPSNVIVRNAEGWQETPLWLESLSAFLQLPRLYDAYATL